MAHDKDEALRLAGASQLAHATLTIVLPIALALLGVATPALWESFGWWVSVPWLFLSLIYLLVWYRGHPTEKSFLGLVLENHDLHEKIDGLEGDLTNVAEYTNALVFQSYAAFALRLMTAEYVRAGINNSADLSEALGEMLAPLYLNGGDTLGFDGSERWSFGVYLYTRSGDELRAVWRERVEITPPKAWVAVGGEVRGISEKHSSMENPSSHQTLAIRTSVNSLKHLQERKLPTTKRSTARSPRFHLALWGRTCCLMAYWSEQATVSGGSPKRMRN